MSVVNNHPQPVSTHHVIKMVHDFWEVEFAGLARDGCCGCGIIHNWRGEFEQLACAESATGLALSSKRRFTSVDSEGDKTTSYTATVKLDSDDGVTRERMINLTPELYRKVEAGNEVVKTADNKHPLFQLGTSRTTS